jgi:hypothetical protein
VQAGFVKPHTHFTSEVYILSKDEGGRHTPFFNGYRPQFYFRTTDVTGSIDLPEGVEMVMPGDNIAMTIKLIARSPWKKVCASPSVKAVVPSAPASSPRSSSNRSFENSRPWVAHRSLETQMSKPENSHPSQSL